jgi:hypothetical protein
MKFLSSIRIVRVTLAVVVASWMAGAGCLLGCGNMTAMAASSEQHSTQSVDVVASGDSCAAMHGHDCCAKRARKSPVETSSESPDSSEASANAEAAVLEHDDVSRSAMDCPMALTASAALSKVQQHEDTSVVLTSGVARQIFSNPTEQGRALAPSLRLPNRGHTYLRCCVFLI